MPEENEPEKNMEGPSCSPEGLVRFEQVGKPEHIPDQPPGPLSSSLGPGVVTIRKGTGVRIQTEKRYRMPRKNIPAVI